MLGHQVGDELVAVDGVELVGFLKIHAKEFARDPVPEGRPARLVDHPAQFGQNAVAKARAVPRDEQIRSEEHTSELQSLMRISYAVFCLKKKQTQQNLSNNNKIHPTTIHTLQNNAYNQNQ